MDVEYCSTASGRCWQQELSRDGRRYRVRELSWHDEARQAAYQRLRAAIFVADRGWSIPVGADGRERDRWDRLTEPAHIRVFCAYGVEGMGATETEYLLAGLRIFELRSWDASMLTHEFCDAGMIDEGTLTLLRERYPDTTLSLLEATRFCVLRGARYESCPALVFDLSIARDLMYAAIFRVSAQTRRRYAICLAESGYRQVLRRSAFCFEDLVVQGPRSRQGYALIVIDLLATIQAIGHTRSAERAAWLLCLCDEDGRRWFHSEYTHDDKPIF